MTVTAAMLNLTFPDQTSKLELDKGRIILKSNKILVQNAATVLFKAVKSVEKTLMEQENISCIISILNSITLRLKWLTLI